MDLLHEIARCPNVQQWFISPQSSNPCSKLSQFNSLLHWTSIKCLSLGVEIYSTLRFCFLAQTLPFEIFCTLKSNRLP